MEIAVLALGCFWGPEIKFSKLNGIIKTEVGYCGGNSDQTTYKEVCTDKTNHAEVVKIEFDNSKISYEEILNYFFEIHNPTSLNFQGPDIGTQYRSCIFTDYEPYIEIAKNAIDALNTSKRYNNPISTILYENVTFFEAENYHQKYLFR